MLVTRSQGRQRHPNVAQRGELPWGSRHRGGGGTRPLGRESRPVGRRGNRPVGRETRPGGRGGECQSQKM